VPANNEEGAPYERALVVELSPWLCDVAVTLDAADAHAPPLEAAGGGWVQRFADRLLTWLQRSRQRRQLATSSDHMLKDMGLSRADVDHETSRRFWQD
jgi:uncharacterized protein YjiS (DUF1127 family)